MAQSGVNYSENRRFIRIKLKPASKVRGIEISPQRSRFMGYRPQRGMIVPSAVFDVSASVKSI